MRRRLMLAAALVALGSPACSGGLSKPPPGLEKIDHVIIIMQENRSFDSYFGTYPGAAGYPRSGGRISVCVPNGVIGTCVTPFHDPNLVNLGGPHDYSDAISDIDDGHMDGFINDAYFKPLGLLNGSKGPAGQLRALTCGRDPRASICARPDLMGYHDAREIPNYWAYARSFVLQDHMFEPVNASSEPSHMYMVSAWSARCRSGSDPATCVTNLTMPDPESIRTQTSKAAFAWTDITWLLHRSGVSWAYYVDPAKGPGCDPSGAICGPHKDIVGTPSLWNPLPKFDTVVSDGQRGNVRPVADLFRSLRDGTLPNVVWIEPNARNSEHPPASVRDGQAWVTTLVNAIGRSSSWRSSAIFVSWDDWGGFYDHVIPPSTRDGLGYGPRVPGLLISPYARRNFVDSQVLSFDAYLKLIEDRFLGGRRLDPNSDGRWDPRPEVRELDPALGNLLSEFDFSQPPRPPLILGPRPSG